ncbi:MAG: hypothetical protein V3U34_06745 [candidate division NC10 bacterium]
MSDLQAQSLTQVVTLLKAQNAVPQDNSSRQDINAELLDEGQESEDDEECFSDDDVDDYDEYLEDGELNLEHPVFAPPATSGLGQTEAGAVEVSQSATISGVGIIAKPTLPVVSTSGLSQVAATSGLSVASGLGLVAEPSLPVASSLDLPQVGVTSGVALSVQQVLPVAEVADTVDRESPLSIKEVRACLLKHGFACNIAAPAVVQSKALEMLGCGPRQTEVFKLLESNLVRSAWEVFDAAFVPNRTEPLHSAASSVLSTAGFTPSNPTIMGYNPRFYSSVPVTGKEPLPTEVVLDKEVTAFGYKPSGFPVPLTWSRCKAVSDNVFRALSALSFADNAKNGRGVVRVS